MGTQAHLLLTCSSMFTCSQSGQQVLCDAAMRRGNASVSLCTTYRRAGKNSACIKKSFCHRSPMRKRWKKTNHDLTLCALVFSLFARGCLLPQLKQGSRFSPMRLCLSCVSLRTRSEAGKKDSNVPIVSEPDG
jgi:hypothetical protein